jgi:Glycosyltransferase family 10 (fucosyltransferase) C-term
MMEPGVYSENPWMFKELQQYATVYSSLPNSSNTVLSHGFLGWHVLQNWTELSGLALPEKQKMMSCIASGLQQFKGHRLRYNFINILKKEIPSINFFGKESNYIPDKMDGLLPYRYSIAIENTSAPWYFTEKITDCFLAYTVPVYYGCKNIGKYFPEKSFINIDIEEPIIAIEKIRQIIENDDWQERIGALQEARELVLNKYQPLAGAAGILRQTKPTVKAKINLKPVSDRLLRKIKNLLK